MWKTLFSGINSQIAANFVIRLTLYFWIIKNLIHRFRRQIKCNHESINNYSSRLKTNLFKNSINRNMQLVAYNTRLINFLHYFNLYLLERQSQECVTKNNEVLSVLKSPCLFLSNVFAITIQRIIHRYCLSSRGINCRILSVTLKQSSKSTTTETDATSNRY